MSQSEQVKKFSDARGQYTVKVSENEVNLECYLLGSLTGGTGSECFHTVSKEKISAFLEEISAANLTELLPLLSGYSSEEWSKFHQLVMKHQTETFVWYETDWDDD